MKLLWQNPAKKAKNKARARRRKQHQRFVNRAGTIVFDQIVAASRKKKGSP